MKLLKMFCRFVLTELKKKKKSLQVTPGNSKQEHPQVLLIHKKARYEFFLQENTNHKQALWSKIFTRFISSNMFSIFFHTYFFDVCNFLTPLFVHLKFFYTSFLSNTVCQLKCYTLKQSLTFEINKYQLS